MKQSKIAQTGMRRYEQILKRLYIITYASMAIGIIAILIGAYALFAQPHTKVVYVTQNAQNRTIPAYNIKSQLFVPPAALQIDPVITTEGQFGKRLTNINSQLNATELAIINNASNAYFETAGEMLLNRTIVNTVSASPTIVPPFVVNGKPSVIYLGSITCIFCGENRWAMALALSRFGSFSRLYKGYSSFGDGDVPTLYWSPAHYNQSTVDLGSFYNSTYINFIPIEDTDPITGGFALQPMQTMQQEVNSSGNVAYQDAMKFIIEINNFQGTPYTIWGGYNVAGADAVDFGNTPPTNAASLPLANMTHADVLGELSKPSDQFAWTEYAAADLYIAMTCKTLNNTAPICSLPAIKGIESTYGY